MAVASVLAGNPPHRVVYFCGGHANMIAAHHAWRAGVQDPSEVSITFSSQIQDACQALGCPTYMVSPYSDVGRVDDGLFTIEHRPKRRASGWRYHLEELRYVWGLLKTARAFRATIALVDSGTAHYFLFRPFRWFGVQVVPILHNTLWPAGFFPAGRTARALLALDRWLFWPAVPSALICVSPQCETQVLQLVPVLEYEVLQIRAQFRGAYFNGLPSARFPEEGRFTVLFIGRVIREKGVFDILEMARRAQEVAPGRIRWLIAGRGPDSEALALEHRQLGLADCVELLGWVSLERLRELYGEAHACIVPTRSGFAEGLAMTAVEAILAGRPLVSNPIVPATELLGPATLMARANDAASHADAVLELSRNPALYGRLRDACPGMGRDFLDPRHGLAPAVRHVLAASTAT